MRTVFCKEELDLENGMSSFSEEQLEMCDYLTTVFSYDVGEIINDIRRRNIVLIIEQFISWWNILIHALWHDLN